MTNKITTKLLIITLLFGLTGCLSDNDLNRYDADVEQDITFRVLQTMNTRGISSPIPDGTPLEFVNGDLYLVTATGVIIRHFRIVSGNGEPCNATNTIGRNYLTRTQGVTIQSVPGSVTRVVIIGNYSDTPQLLSTGYINSDNFLGKTLDVVSQHNARNVNLTNCPVSTFTRTIGGTSVNGHLYQRTPASGSTRALYATTVHLAPTVARFEIADITGMGMIAEFTVYGIFMDGIYLQARINGEPVGALHSGGQIANNFTATSHNNPATPLLHDASFGIHDWRGNRNWTGTNTTSLTVRPDNLPPTNVFHPNEGTHGTTRPRYNTWAYQVFARDYHPNTAARTPTPRIIIRLRDVKLTNGFEFQTDQFLTVQNFHFINQNGVFERLDYIRASRVYRIEAGELTFDELDLSDRPNERPIDVNVTVTLAVWREVELEVII